MKTFKSYQETELVEGSSDTADMYALMVKGLKSMPGSPKQKEIIKQINVIRKRMGMKLMKEDFNFDEASKLPPRLAKFFDKKGNPKPEVAARMRKGARRREVETRITDVTPKGYGPKEELELGEVDDRRQRSEREAVNKISKKESEWAKSKRLDKEMENKYEKIHQERDKRYKEQRKKQASGKVEESIELLKSLKRPQYTIKNTKTGQNYSSSRYQDDKKLDKIRKGGGDHKHAAHFKDGKVIEGVEVDEAKSKLPPHLAKFFDKDGNLKKDAAARVAKGREKINWIDVTPKGYGPKEEDTKHSGGETMMNFKQAIGEAFFKVNIPDMPPVFIEGGSASAIKQDMRKKLKPDVLKGLEIEKVSRADMAKMYRKLAKGDSEEGEAQEEVSESMKLQATMALGDAGIKTNWKGGKLYVPKKDIKKAEKALSKSFRKGGEPDLYYEEVSEATGDKEAYQKKREAIAAKFGVKHGGEIKDPKKKKAYYNALDKAHVADHEEETKKEAVRILKKLTTKETTQEGVKMSVVKRFLSERRGKIQTDEANKATERKVRADYHKMEGDKKRMEKLASKYRMKKDEVQGIIMKEDSWSDQSHKWDESPHNDDRYKLSNAMPHMGVEAKEDMEGPYLYHDKMFFWSPGEQKFWSEDAGNWISDVDAKEMMYSFMKGLWQGRKGALPAIKR